MEGDIGEQQGKYIPLFTNAEVSRGSKYQFWVIFSLMTREAPIHFNQSDNSLPKLCTASAGGSNLL